MKKIPFNLKFYFMAMMIFYSCACNSQQKRKLNPEEYTLWNTLKMGKASDNGIWTSFSKSYQSTDTLYLKSSINDSQYVFPSGYNEQITPNGKFFAYMKADSLFVLETMTGKKSRYPNVMRYEFTKNGKYLVFLRDEVESATLCINNIVTGRTEKLQNVTEYSLNPKGTSLAIIQNSNEAYIIKMDNQGITKRQIAFNSCRECYFQDLTWNAEGKSLACYIFDKVKGEYDIMHIADINKPALVRFLKSSEYMATTPKAIVVKTKIHISDNGNMVFFDVRNDAYLLENTSSKVQIWKSSDKQLPPATSVNFLQWHVWLPFQNRVYTIEDQNLVACAMANDQEQVVLLDNSRYLPLYEYGDRYSDVYVMDLKTGKKEKIIQKQLISYNHLVSNPNGRYIAYFKDKQWWSYNSKTKIHTCITKDSGTEFNKSSSDRLDDHRAHGFGGWTSTGQMIVYDEFDIWIISPEGRKTQKITSGAFTGMRNRLPSRLESNIKDSFFGFMSTSYDLSEGLLVQTVDTKVLSEGFGVWYAKDGFKELVHHESKILYIKRVGKDNAFQFIESAFDTPPKIINLSHDGKQTQIAQANEQQKKFHWGKSTLVHYNSPDGRKLKGALFYPANYNAAKKYPMIVSIYENMSGSLHEYVTPSSENPAGFNITNFTLEGYFVLLPDIAYTLNKPGSSALQCVSAAIDQAIAKGSIDEDSIGLIGHSFGGFETTYIISQTDRFKTAIAGAGVTDLLSFYLDIDSANLSNMERFESEQLRNKIPFTEQEFITESPIMNVKTINTPVLLWTGANDRAVAPSYNKKLYAALWRLQKQSMLLIYPEEEHVLIKPVNQKDITSKTMGWFNYYLKSSPKEEWMK
ncbi:S9 family peptidase [Flavobacterium sp.]|uniref:S9 family peptidase n=1 Tax=Flavobacterium sp. TaxID=239 RepID=UPI0040341343